MTEIPVALREGRPEDLEAIREFTTDTFAWGDYVPDEYLDWLAEPSGAVLVAADAEDRVLAMVHIEQLSPKEGWLSAARVRPDYQRRGLGSRRTARVRRRVEVRCRTLGEMYATMVDVSTSGLALIAASPVRVGDELRVEISVSNDGKAIGVTGEAINVRPEPGGRYRVGMRFASLTPEQRTTLEGWIRDLLHGRQGGGAPVP